MQTQKSQFNYVASLSVAEAQNQRITIGAAVSWDQTFWRNEEEDTDNWEINPLAELFLQ